MTEKRQGFGEKPFDYYLGLARSLPKISSDDPRIEPYLQVVRSDNPRDWWNTPFPSFYGNNFYALFLVYKEPPEEDNIMGMHTRIAQVGDRWAKFLAANEGLLREIEVVVDVLKPAEELREFYYAAMIRRPDQYRKIDEVIGSPMGFDAIWRPLIERMNPLLQRAAVAMESAGIDPEIFQG